MQKNKEDKISILKAVFRVQRPFPTAVTIAQPLINLSTKEGNRARCTLKYGLFVNSKNRGNVKETSTFYCFHSLNSNEVNKLVLLGEDTLFYRKKKKYVKGNKQIFASVGLFKNSSFTNFLLICLLGLNQGYCRSEQTLYNWAMVVTLRFCFISFYYVYLSVY